MNRYIAINPSRCTGCNACRVACSSGHADAGRQSTPRLDLVEDHTCEDGTVITGALVCHHCEGAPCLKVCPVNAIRRDPDGCVRVDEHKCIGCKLCACACPFGAIRMGGTGLAGIEGYAMPEPPSDSHLHPLLDWQIGIQKVAVKCDLCSYDDHPHCVAACTTRALRLVESADPNGEIHDKRVLAGRRALSAFLTQDTSQEGGDAR